MQAGKCECVKPIYPLTQNCPYLILIGLYSDISRVKFVDSTSPCGGLKEVYNIVTPFRQYLSLLSCLSLVLLMFSGCAGLGKRLESPRITLSNIKVQQVTVFESVFEIEIRLFNTNEIALEIKGIDCDLELNGRRFATGVSNAQIKVPPYTTALVPVTVYSSVLDLVRGLPGLSKTEKLEYKITGSLRLGPGTIPAVIPFKSSGELPLGGLSLPEDT